MKKTFQLTAPNRADERQVEAIKKEIKKYIARERRKPVKDNIDFWDFDCRIGVSETEHSLIHISEINKSIDGFASSKQESIYLELLAKPGFRKKK